MQFRSLTALLVLLVTPAASLAVAAESDARLWLEARGGAPNGDQLAELKTANPEAYAIVKALLTKRSLGLLNAKHPSASFAAPPPSAEEKPGPEVFTKLMSPAERHSRPRLAAAEVSVPYAEVMPAAHHDWLSWKPQQANDDEAMVANVLGAVAQLKGGKKAGLISQARQTEESSLAADEDAFGAPSEPAPTPVKVSQPAAAAPQEKKVSSHYIDFGVMAQPAAPAEPKPKTGLVRENSYLKGLDLTTDSEKKESSGKNFLASFSWNDNAKPQSETKPVPKVVAPKVSAKENSLMSWLGVTQQKPAPVQAPPPQAVKPSNPYLMDLSS